MASQGKRDEVPVFNFSLEEARKHRQELVDRLNEIRSHLADKTGAGGGNYFQYETLRSRNIQEITRIEKRLAHLKAYIQKKENESTAGTIKELGVDADNPDVLLRELHAIFNKYLRASSLRRRKLPSCRPVPPG